MEQSRSTSRLKIIALIATACLTLCALPIGIVVTIIKQLNGKVSEFVSPITFKSAADEFRISVLEIKSGSNSLSEHVLVICTNDVNVGIEVVDLAKTGISEKSDSTGGKYFQVGHPYQAGQSEVVHVHGNQATCEIIYSVSINVDKTSWTSQLQIAQTNGFSSEKSSTSTSTTLNEKLAIGSLRTNWPNSFPRRSWVPLGDLGRYKIVVTLE